MIDARGSWSRMIDDQKRSRASEDTLEHAAQRLRIERGVSYHGIALNISVDLEDFALIDPCGMPGVESTSVARELGRPSEPPSTASVERAAWIFAEAFAAAIDAPLAIDR